MDFTHTHTHTIKMCVDLKRQSNQCDQKEHIGCIIPLILDVDYQPTVYKIALH